MNGQGEVRTWAHGPECAYPEATLDQLIVEQAMRTPDATAVCQRDKVLTYAGLVSSAEAIACRLRSEGTGPEDRVGICLRRTLELPVAVLGVLFAGGAYVPLDQSHPAQRLAGIIDAAGARLVIADEPGRALLTDSGARLIEPLPLHQDGALWPPDVAESGTVPDNAAYVMYTSGSTGLPKGVVVSHRNVAAFAAAAQARCPIGPGCRSAGFASLGFDTSLFDLLIPLALGATVALVPDADRIDPLRLARFLAGHRVTRAMLPPAVLPLLDPGGLPDLTDIFSAGEPCGPEQVARWSAGHRRFHNWYGPTETTVIVVGAELTGTWDRPLPIGTPLPGCRAWVLDEALAPCPPGVAGELHIGGPQLARGYLGEPGQTAGRFIPDPLGEPGSRLYRTGDLVRWDADGTIEYLGRLDRQVKIGGQRAEIGEIEAVLQAHPSVSQAVVDVTRGPAGITQLIAYVAPTEAPGLREICAARLPEHMIPARLFRLPALPLNVSGKVDLAALRAIAAQEERAMTWPDPADAGQGTAGQLAIALLVGQAWGEVFQTASPGPDEEFIALGGHSLLAMRLVTAVRARTGRQLEVEDVYRGRTVAGLAQIAAQAPAAQDDEAIPAGSPPALTAAQRRMWFVEQLSPDCPMHNVAMAQRLHGSLDVAALSGALRLVAGRHQVFRWRVISRAGQPHVLADAADPELAVTDLTELTTSERDDALRQALEHEASVPFVLDEGPLWRARLIRLTPDLQVLAITVHHLIFDGWSRDVLYHDLGLAYRTARDGRPAEPEPLAIQYSDFAAWSAAQARRRSGTDLAWWLEHLTGAPLVLDLPRDAARPPVHTFTGAKAQLTLDPAVATAVRAVALTTGTTCFAVLLAAFAQLVRRLTGQLDLIIGTPAADRGPAAFESLIGLCLHMLPLRLIICDDDSFDDHLRRTAAELSAVLSHPHAPAERITESLGQQRDLSRNPLFQVLFNAYDFTSARLELDGIAASPEPEGMAGALFDLTLYVGERAEQFDLRAVYNADLYSAARIEALLAAYGQLVGDLTAFPDRAVAAASARPPGVGLPDASMPLSPQTGPGALDRVLAGAALSPLAVAVTGAGGELRYRDLLNLASRTRAALADAGVSAGDAVAVLAARDVSLPAILLGVLASGGRWLVLDSLPGDPRIARQLAAARVTTLIRMPGTELPRSLPSGITVLDAPVFDGAVVDDSAVTEDVAVVPPAMRGYLSMTSGTTGEAKIVTASDRPLGHFLGWYPVAFELGPADRFAMLSGLGHDPLLRDVFTPLAIGGRLCVPAQQWLRDPARLARWLRAEQITVVHVTPQAARLLAAVSEPAALPLLRLIALGGDLATTADVIRLRAIAPAARIINCYGTTETPQIQAWHEISLAGQGLARPGLDGTAWPGQPLPVGRGIEGAQLLVVGHGGRPAAVGELGDVVIRSRHLAAGYARGDDDHGAGGSRFRPGPSADPDDRSFATGDLGRYLPDGIVALAGRADRQVKIRGFRVEPGEAEAVLRACPEVSQACVAVTSDGDERQLWAYVVPADSGVDAAVLGDQLRASLPEYAVPAGVSLIAALPLTANGKVDLPRLPRPVPVGRRVSGGEPATATERAIARAWSEVLGAPGFGVTDNFFDLGGHSLAVVAVQARLAELLGKTIPVVDLFRYPVIRALATHIDGTDAPKLSAEVARATQRAAQRRDLARRRPARPPRRS